LVITLFVNMYLYHFIKSLNYSYPYLQAQNNLVRLIPPRIQPFVAPGGFPPSGPPGGPPGVPPGGFLPIVSPPEISPPRVSPPGSRGLTPRVPTPVGSPTVGPIIGQLQIEPAPVGPAVSPQRRSSPRQSPQQSPQIQTPEISLPPVQFRNNVQPSIGSSIFRLVFGGTAEEKYATQRESFRTLLMNIINEKREIIQLMEIARDPMVQNRKEDLEIFVDDSNVIFNEQFPELFDASKNSYRLELINNFRQILQHEQDLRRRLTETVHIQSAAAQPVQAQTLVSPQVSPAIQSSPSLQATQLRQQEQARRAEEQRLESERLQLERAQQQQAQQQQLLMQQQQAQLLAAQAAQLAQPPPQPNLVNLRALPLRQRGRLPAQIDLRLQLEALSNQQLEEIALGNGTSTINNIPVKYLGLSQRDLNRYKNKQGVLNAASLIQSIVTATRTASLILRGGEMLNIEQKRRRWYFYINGVEGSRKALDLNHAAIIVQQFRFQYPFTQVRLGSPGKFSVVFGEEVPMPKAFSYSSNNNKVNINGFY